MSGCRSLKSSYGNRILATEWDTHKELSFLVYIYIKGIDSMGLLNEVTQVISRQLNVNIRKLTIETNDGIFEGKIQLWVHDVEDVKTICNNLEEDSEYQAGKPRRRIVIELKMFASRGENLFPARRVPV